MTKEYRAVFSRPPSIYGPSPDSYSQPVTDPKKLPKWSPRSEEDHGWVSGTQVREVTEWETLK